MLKKICIGLLIFLLVISGNGCEQPVDPIIRAVDDTNMLLQRYVWELSEFRIYTRENDIPPPLLFRLNEIELKAGEYDIGDMALDPTEMLDFSVIFTESRDMIASGGPIDALGDSVSRYFVVNENVIRITAEESLNWRYIYNGQDKELGLSVTDENARRLIEKANEDLVDAVAGRTPNRTGEIIAGILFNSDTIQKLINDLLVDALAGKLEFINDLDPEETSQRLAEQIIAAIQVIDWESQLTALLKTELDKLNNIDVDAVSAAIAQEITGIIDQTLSTENIYEFVLPFIEQMASRPDETAQAISSLIVNEIILNIFSEDNLQGIISEAWVKFTRLNEEQVSVIADTLTRIVQDKFINTNSISQLVLPVTSKIDETSIIKMGDLAKEATELIEGLVDQLNTTFPDLNLMPDYESMQSALKAAFIVAKPIISSIGPDQVANEVADLVVAQFLNFENIQSAFVAIITSLQQLDPEMIGETIGTWLSNLAQDVAPEIITYLTDQLSPIFENLNPEFTAFQIARALNAFVKANINEANIYALVRPLVQALADINAEEVANLIAKGILDLDIIKDTVNEENIRALLLPILQNISDLGAENLVQGIINAIVASGIFEDVITEDRVATIIALVIYIDLWENVKIANNFEEAVIVLRHD